MADKSNSRSNNPGIPVIWTIEQVNYSISQTCHLLRISVNRVRALVERDDDPMPFRCFPNSQRGAFIHKDDLRQWIVRNTVLLHDEKIRTGRDDDAAE